MKKISGIIFFTVLTGAFLSCRETPPETPQEEQMNIREGELGDDGAMDVD